MPYINYDENGNIIAQFACQQYEGQLYTDIVDLTNYKIIDGNVVDITNTPEYKLQQFQKSIQYQHDAFNEYAREIVYQIQYNTALSNTTMILDLEEQLQTEQEAVIARINAITEAYNNAST